MHQVHHSRVPRETDSNFSSVFSVWDRMFGSFCAVDRPGDIRFGLDGYDQSHAQTIAGMLSTPFSHGPERGQ
jgi:sterol desaturase/sphingolipid hydroxylase (fatty acid hydroxylase superfamily)